MTRTGTFGRLFIQIVQPYLLSNPKHANVGRGDSQLVRTYSHNEPLMGFSKMFLGIWMLRSMF